MEMTVKQCVELYLDAHLGEVADTTLAWYASHLKDLGDLEDREVSSISINDLRSWRAELLNREVRYDGHPFHPQPEEQKLSVYTIIGKVKVVRSFFRWLVDEGVLERNPARRLKAPDKPENPEPRAIPEQDILAIRDYALKNGMHREVALIHILAESGARVQGVAGLKLEHCHLEDKTLIVTEKGKKTRPVYVLDAGAEALRVWLRHRPNVDHDYVFTSRTGARLSEGGIRQALKRAAVDCGIGRYNPHAFRHAFAREMLNAGLSLEAVASLMGHKHVSTTADSYAIWTKKELAGKHEKAAKKRGLWDH